MCLPSPCNLGCNCNLQNQHSSVKSLQSYLSGFRGLHSLGSAKCVRRGQGEIGRSSVEMKDALFDPQGLAVDHVSPEGTNPKFISSSSNCSHLLLNSEEDRQLVSNGIIPNLPAAPLSRQHTVVCHTWGMDLVVSSCGALYQCAWEARICVTRLANSRTHSWDSFSICHYVIQQHNGGDK